MLALLGLLGLHLQPPEASSRAAPCKPVPAFAPGAQEGFSFQIKHNGNHQENGKTMTPAMPITVLSGRWHQCIVLGNLLRAGEMSWTVRLVQHAEGLLCHMKVCPWSLG